MTSPIPTVAAAYSVPMPSSVPSLRPVLAALVATILVAAPALLLAPAASAAAPVAAPAQPAIPPEPADDAPVSLRLVSLDPTSLAPGGTLSAEVEVTNTSEEEMADPGLALRLRSARVTDRSQLASWQAGTGPDTAGDPIAEAAEETTLAPGESVTLRVEAPAEEIGLSEQPYYWGTRRLSLTVSVDGEAVSSIRSFVVWRPEGTEDAITQSVLLPVTASDPGLAATDPEAYAASLQDGQLASLSALSERDDVDLWMDPSLLDPPAIGTGTGEEPTAEEQEAQADAADGEEAEASPTLSYAPAEAASTLAETLTTSATSGDRTVLAMPYAQADLVSLRSAGGTTLLEELQEQSAAVTEETGVEPGSMVLPVAGAEANGAALEKVAAAGVDTALVPSSSLRENPAGTITPSSIGTYTAEGDEAPSLRLLAPDPVLSAEFSQLTGATDTEQVTQRLLAETATVASEYTEAPRHLLISPEVGTALDAEAAGAALDALDEAGWVTSGRTQELLDAAEEGTTTTSTRGGGEDLYALGDLGPAGVHPSEADGEGGYRHASAVAEPTLLTPSQADRLETACRELDVLGSALGDTATLDLPRLLALSGASWQWRDHTQVPGERAREARQQRAALVERIHVVPASGYNLISDEAGVPITITNGLDTSITVQVAVTSDKQLVRIGEQPVVEVPPRGEVSTTVPVEAIANGTVTLSARATTEDGQALTEPVDVPLSVNPAWENWTTMVLVVAMGALVVVGVARARRTGSSKRAPAVHGPEDPVELSRSGRSRPDRDPAPPGTGSGTGAGDDAAPPQDPPTDDPQEGERP